MLSDTVTLGGQAVHIAQRLDESPYIGSGNYTAITGLILVVPDEEATSLYRAMGGTQEQFAYSAAFDVDATPEQIAALQEDLWTRLNGICGIYAAPSYIPSGTPCTAASCSLASSWGACS